MTKKTKALVKTEEPKLTFKEAKFLKHYLKHGNGTKAAHHAFDCKNDNTARTIGSQVLAKLNVSLTDLLEAHSLTFVDSIKVVKDAYKAERIPKGADQPVADHLIRLKAIQIVDRWLGVEKAQAQQPKAGRRVTIEEWSNGL